MNDEHDYMIIDHESDVLMISFGGHHEGFNFVKLGERLGLDGLYFHDHHLDWYLSGVRRISPDMNKVCRFIRDFIGGKDRRRVFFIGQSSGGYAGPEIRIGSRTRCSHAFSPQTMPLPSSYTGVGSLDGIELSRPDDSVDDVVALSSAAAFVPGAGTSLESEADNPPDTTSGMTGSTLVDSPTSPPSKS